MSVQTSPDYVNVNELVENSLHLVTYVINRFYRPHPHKTEQWNELMSVGTIGLIKAARRFNPERAQFTTYAITTIRGEIQNHLRKMKRHEGHASLDEIHYHFIGTTNDDKLREDIENKINIQMALSQLNEEKRILIERNFGLNGRPAEPISKIPGKSSKTWYKLKREALAELKMLLSAQEESLH